jgi:sulfur transfer complex TusBCD TusB component (DsrH family)
MFDEIDYAAITIIILFSIIAIIAFILFFLKLPYNDISEGDYYIYTNFNNEYKLYQNGMLIVENITPQHIDKDKLLMYFEDFDRNNITNKIKENRIKTILLALLISFSLSSFSFALIFHNDVKNFIQIIKNKIIDKF